LRGQAEPSWRYTLLIPPTLNALLQPIIVLSETRPVSDDRDTAEACTEHPSCIRGFIAKPKYGYPNAAGWWHLEWDQADELWHATDPGGEAKDVQVAMPVESTMSVNRSVARTRCCGEPPTHRRIPDHSIITVGSSPSVHPS